MDTLSSQTCRLPLHEEHSKFGAKWGSFGAWEVPLYYTTILEEHEAVRKRAGLFDISHMGFFRIQGKSSESFLEGLLPRRVSKMVLGQALYNPLLNERGGFVDDIIVYRFSPEGFYLIVNAGNVAKDFQWISSQLTEGVECQNLSPKKGILSLQGPLSAGIMEEVFGAGVTSLKYYRFKETKSGIIARTGYTGEDGFEIVTDREELPGLWQSLMMAGQPKGLVPVGFGARDTLRFEAAMPLYGHDMNDDISPLEAGMDWAVDLTKESFVGREALLNLKAAGIPRKLVGFEMVGRGVPRQDYDIAKAGRVIGKVTSGSFSPTLKKNLGLGYVRVEEAVMGNEVDIMIRGSAVKAKIVSTPFYKRKR